MKSFLSGPTSSTHLLASDDDKENKFKSVAASEQQLSSRPRSAVGLSEKRTPDTPAIHYRGIRSLKHKHDKNYAEGLRKSSSIHDLPSATNAPVEQLRRPNTPVTMTSRALRRRTVSADVTLLDQSFDLTHVTSLSTNNLSSDYTSFLLTATPSVALTPSLTSSLAHLCDGDAAKSGSSRTGAVPVHAANTAPPPGCNHRPLNNNDDDLSNNNLSSCVTDRSMQTPVSSRSSTRDSIIAQQCSPSHSTHHSPLTSTAPTNLQGSSALPHATCHSPHPLKMLKRKATREPRLLPQIPTKHAPHAAPGSVASGERANPVPVKRSHVSRGTERVPRPLTPSAARKTALAVTSSLARREMHNKVATVARMWELRSQSSGRASADVTKRAFGVDYRQKSSSCSVLRARSAPPLASKHLQVAASCNDITAVDDATHTRFRSPSPIVIKMAPEPKPVDDVTGGAAEFDAQQLSVSSDATLTAAETELPPRESPSKMIQWQVRGEVEMQSNGDRKTSGRPRRKLPVPVLSAASLSSIHLPESVFQSISADDVSAERREKESPEESPVSQVEQRSSPEVPLVLVTSHSMLEAQVQWPFNNYS